MEPLRKLIAILVLTVFGLPFASPLFALSQSVGDGVRACCRKAGKHHCMEGMDAMNTGASGPQWSSQPEKCPFTPQASLAVHHEVASAPPSAAIYAAIVSHPCGVAQTQSKWRIAQIRSRQKRGPPVLSSL